jgi:hypothetical protein
LNGELDISLWGRLCLLLEGMQHQNPIFQCRQVDDPEGPGGFPYPDFANTGTDRWHGLPVIWIKPSLHEFQLPTGVDPGILGKRPNIGSATSKPLDQLHSGTVSKQIQIDQQKSRACQPGHWRRRG